MKILAIAVALGVLAALGGVAMSPGVVLANAGCITPPSNMTGWWDGDDVSGSTAYDIQGSNDATLVGGATTASGLVGNSFSLDGSSGYLNLGEGGGTYETASFTWDLWIQPASVTSDGSYRTILAKGIAQAGVGTRHHMHIRDDDTIHVGLGGSSDFWFAYNASFTAGVWTHLAWTYDGSYVRIYQDGALLGSWPYTGGVPSTSNDLWIGRNYVYDEWFHGLMDEIELYDRALSLAEIKAIYDAGSAGKCKPGDTTPPTLTIECSPTTLWPPNHKMVTVTVSTTASDDGGAVTISASVSSNEPPDGLGDGDTSPDWANLSISSTGQVTLDLRAERSGTGDGRIYTIAITATDASGNATTKTCEVVVPKSKGT